MATRDYGKNEERWKGKGKDVIFDKLTGQLTVEGALQVDGTVSLNGQDISDELAYVNGVTPGTAAASKALVLDSSRDITNVRNFTATKFIGQATQLFDGGTDPVNAAYASARLTLTGEFVPAAYAVTKLVVGADHNAAENDTITIGSAANEKIYTFKNAPANPYEVKVGATVAESIDNFYAALLCVTGGGTLWGTGTVYNALCYPYAKDATSISLVSRTLGTSINTEATTTSEANWAFADTTFGGGTGDSDPGVGSGASQIAIGGTTYTFMKVLSETYASNWAVANEVLFGTNSEEALTHLKMAVNLAAVGSPREYSTGTVINPLATATDIDATHLTFVNKTVGTAGNQGGAAQCAVGETLANAAFDGAVTYLTGGVDGTVGAAGEIRWSTSYLYLCTQANTAATAYWYKAQLTQV